MLPLPFVIKFLKEDNKYLRIYIKKNIISF